MRFFEFEAREIVKRAGIPVSDFGFTTDPAQAGEIARRIGGPTVIKSQVLSGGRMKAGGVKFADTPEQAQEHAAEILKLEIGGHRPRGVLVDPKAEVEQEYYAGVVWDGTRKQPVMIFSPVGGIDAAAHRGVAGNVTEFDGNLGLVIGAGGGSLTLFDAVRAHGGKPANYCEIGGNPSVSKTCGLAKLVLSKPGVERIAVMMSIVSNTRVDIVARGVIKACIELGYDPAEKIAIFRIPGAWEDEGFKILERYGVEYADRSVSLHEAARREVEKIQGAPAGAGSSAAEFPQTAAELGAETDV